MPTITSRQHALVRTCRAVARGDEERAVIDGWHLLHDAARSGMHIDAVALVDAAYGEADRNLIERLASQLDVAHVTRPVMAALSPVRTPSGVVAIVRKRRWPPTALVEPPPALIVMATDLQDPGNVGAVVRSAEAGGATGVMLTGASADPWGWKALRAAMGSTFRMPVVSATDALTGCDRIASAGVRVIAATPRDGPAMYEVDLRGPVAIVIGGEGAGVTPDLLARADERLTIPMAAGVESLNAAVAAALLVYEAARQRRTHRADRSHVAL